MNKKIVIAIIASVVALAIIITGVVLLLTSSFTFNPNSESLNQNSTTSQTDTAKNDDQASTNSNGGKDSYNSNNVLNENKTEDNVEDVEENAPNKSAFYIANTKGKTGGKIKVPVKVVKNPGFMAFIINFQYDTSILKYTGYSKGNVLSSYDIEDNNGTIKFLALENGDVKKDGTLVYLEFDVITNSKTETEIKLNIPEKSVANYNEQFVTLASQNGKVIIK